MLLGIVELINSLSKISEKMNLLDEYLNKVDSYALKLGTGEEQEELVYLLSKSSKISKIAGESVWDMPILDLESSLKHRKYQELSKYLPLIIANHFKRKEFYQDLRIKTKNDFRNPFTLFYRGIELIMRYSVGYIITKFDANFDFNSKSWKRINAIISLLAGIATIIQLIITINF
jgi:hypothetical protein